MAISTIAELREIILEAVRNITNGDWKVLVIDESSKRILDTAVKEDDILNQQISNIERIEERREMQTEMDAVYILSPQSHVVECLVADFEVGRYRSGYLVWTSRLGGSLRRRLEESSGYHKRRAGFDTLLVDFFPKESHLVTFRDPWSFPYLFHPACNNLVREHLNILAQKIMSVCVLLGEKPKIRFYRPKNASHEAHVLCEHLARFVQDELDQYAEYTNYFGKDTGRPPSVLLITDRSMDLWSPLMHEFTYQAMAHDVLPIKDGDKVVFHMVSNRGRADAEEKDAELAESDKVWVENRHRHMKDTIDKLMGDFQKFIDQNPQFANTDAGSKTNLNTIKDMLAGLPQFQTMKDAYSLHLTMAQECMDQFAAHKLLDLSSIEQTLATGLDEDYKKPKNVLDQIVRLLDDEQVTHSDRLRLVMAYVMYRDGVIAEDIKRLLAHSDLPGRDMDVIVNLELLGARTTKDLKETRTPPLPLFPKNPKAAPPPPDDGSITSRFEPVLQQALEELCKGTLDQGIFPYTGAPLDPSEELLASQGSLRAPRANWAGRSRRPAENRQRLMVFVAGGATYSESRACYEASVTHGRDVFLITSHMLTPKLFVRQLGDLSVDKRRLDLPLERPKPKAPAYLFERPGTGGGGAPPGPGPGPGPGGMQMPQQPMAPSSSSMGMSMSSGKHAVPPPRPPGGLPGRPGRSPAPPIGAMSQMSLGARPSSNGSGSGSMNNVGQDDGKLHKKKRDKFWR